MSSVDDRVDRVLEQSFGSPLTRGFKRSKLLSGLPDDLKLELRKIQRTHSEGGKFGRRIRRGIAKDELGHSDLNGKRFSNPRYQEWYEDHNEARALNTVEEFYIAKVKNGSLTLAMAVETMLDTSVLDYARHYNAEERGHMVRHLSLEVLRWSREEGKKK